MANLRKISLSAILIVGFATVGLEAIQGGARPALPIPRLSADVLVSDGGAPPPPPIPVPKSESVLTADGGAPPPPPIPLVNV